MQGRLYIITERKRTNVERSKGESKGKQGGEEKRKRQTYGRTPIFLAYQPTRPGAVSLFYFTEGCFWLGSENACLLGGYQAIDTVMWEGLSKQGWSGVCQA